jgi:Xaa-Pro aminopeptidase
MTDFRFPHRLSGLRALLPETDIPVDAFIISTIENARYLSGFTGSNALIIVTDSEALFLTDGRYALQSATEAPGFERVIVPQGTPLMKAAAEQIKRLGIYRVGFESHALPFGNYAELRKELSESVELLPRPGAAENLRAIKDEDEVAAIRRAIAAADDCWTHIQNVARVGRTEKEVAWEVEVFLRRDRGASRLGFESIIASGPNSALIHGRASERIIGSSGGPEFLLCDYGCELNNYNSDITRTLVIGGEPTPRMRELYEAVKAAQAAALAAIRPGIPGKDVDKAARDVLTDAGLGEAFGHSTGHGLGRVTHDWPSGIFRVNSETILKPGMVCTVEPGAYIEGFGGVRIEDDILVTEGGCEVLTRSPKDLIVLG